MHFIFLQFYLFVVYSILIQTKFVNLYFYMYIINIAQNVVQQTRQAFLLFKTQVLSLYVLAVQYFCQWLHYDNL